MASTSKRPILKTATFRSRFEEQVADLLEASGVPYEYEPEKVPYTIPARDAKYIPDFKLNGRIYVETKGRFGGPRGWKASADDRQKLILVKEQHPEMDLRIVFMNPNQKIYPGSKTTYGQWADSHGFKWAVGDVPTEWIEEALGLDTQ